MKHWKLILGIVVLIIIVFILLFFFLSQKTSPVQNSNPESNPFGDTLSGTPNSLAMFTENCFKWYAQASESNLEASNVTEYNQQADFCFAPNFVNQWDEIADDTDTDPVLLAQDIPPSWATSVSVAIASQASSSATAIVNLGSGNDSKQVIAQLQSTSNGWRIESVSTP